MHNALTGRMLVAMPGIGDARFERAVIYVCVHSEEDAMGLAVNRPVEGLTLPDMLGRLGLDVGENLAPEPVLIGGPVAHERGFVLHTDDYASPEGSLEIAEGISLTATRDVLDALAKREDAPRRAVFALGYAGWGPGQLEEELKHNVWLVCDADEALLFGADHEHKWSAALAKLGVDAASLSAQAGQA